MTIGIRTGNYLKRLAIVLGGFVFLLSSAALVDKVFANGPQAPANLDAGEHVLTIHDRGEERVVVTRAKTVKEALELAKIEISQGHDVVEPSLSEELVASRYNINIYRARPITVIDGLVKKRITTAEQSTEGIARAASIKLYNEDLINFESSPDTLVYASDRVMNIDRATPLDFTLYGKRAEVRTRATTVKDFLEEKDIKIAENDSLSVPLDVAITAGMSIELWRDGTQTITAEEEVDFPVEQIQDANRAVGYKEVRTPGQKGSRNVTYEIEMKNGKEVSRKEIASVTTKEPKKQVEVVGTKISLPPGSHQDWMRAAGISEGDFGYVNAIFSQESGWNPAAANPNGLYYGLGQTNLNRLQSACGGGWASDPVCQIKVFDDYAKGRYGTWKSAYEFKFGSPGKAGVGWW